MTKNVGALELRTQKKYVKWMTKGYKKVIIEIDLNQDVDLVYTP